MYTTGNNTMGTNKPKVTIMELEFLWTIYSDIASLNLMLGYTLLIIHHA